MFCGNIIGFFQCLRYRGFMFRAILPEIKLTGVFTPDGIGNIKHISQFRSVAVVIQESNSLGTAPHISAHRIVPEVIFRTGGSIRPLGENHHLLRKRILIKPGCGGKKGRPPLVAAGQPGGHLFGHLCIALQFTRHKANLLSSIMELKKATQRSLIKYAVLFYTPSNLGNNRTNLHHAKHNKRENR